MPGLPLSLPEREEILLALIADRDVSWAELARRVGRHPTTMARVVAASGGRHGYRPIVAQRSAIDLQKRGRTRVLVLACIPVTPIMTLSIPEAFQSTGIWFGVAYLGVQLIVLGMQGAVAMADQQNVCCALRQRSPPRARGCPDSSLSSVSQYFSASCRRSPGGASNAAHWRTSSPGTSAQSDPASLARGLAPASARSQTR